MKATLIRTLGVLATLALAVAGFGAALATGHGNPHDGDTTTTGHTPVTICHKPGTPAEQSLVVDDDSVELTGHLGHGDTIGPCGQTPPVDYCDTLEGVQAEDEDCPEPTTPTETTPTTPTPTTPTPTTPTPPAHDCVFVGADKDGGQDAYGGTNDDCAPAPTDPAPVVETTPSAVAATPPPEAPTVTTAPPVVVVTAKPKPARHPAAKPKAKPKPDKPVVKRKSTRTCPAPAYMRNGLCVRDYKGKPYPVARGNG